MNERLSKAWLRPVRRRVQRTRSDRPKPTPREPDSEPRARRDLRGEVVPPALLVLALAIFAAGNAWFAGRFGTNLVGGRLHPVADLGTTWSDYLGSWRPVAGGTGAMAPPSLAVLALLGSVLGGPAVVVWILLLFGVPLAGLSAYLASRAITGAPLRRVLVAAYALVPVASLAAGQGRLDVVVAHVLVPPLLSGIAAVIRRSDGQWLGTACLTALGLATLGAFAPLVQLALIVLALLGYVLVPGSSQLRGRRRAAGLVALVLLSVACLLPWPVTWLRHPELLLHGLGARVIEDPATVLISALSPDGSLAGLPGGLLVLAAVVALVVCWRRRMLLGAGVATFGWALAAIVGTVSAEPMIGGAASPGWTGGPLILVAAGCAWILLSARVPAVPAKIAAPVLGVALAALAAGSAFALNTGPLRVAADTEQTGTEQTGTRLLLDPGPQPARLVTGNGPRFGDDALAPAGEAASWLARVDADLRSGDRDRVRGALAAVAARGSGRIIAPADSRLADLGAGLVAEEGRLPDGRRALRLLLPSAPVNLVGPDLARRAQTEAGPSPEARPLPVAASLPDFTVRVSAGGVGRALVLGAENEPGWYARIDGREVPLATAWNHQVAVQLPDRPAEVQVGYTELPRTTLLVVQAAVVLFTLVASIPGRRRKDRPQQA
ncbi:hypothetical protein GCM10009854_14680 [Saccharopolyspora halophila]|uniref:Uncharacterized protein n=1 Tax=Saccharopolyspora halophila TaxID=405551 RepID=A0ABP5SVR8_9PSEU